MAWPPNPEKNPPSHNDQPLVRGEEWKLLEKTLLASVAEQRASRRWGIFFKLVTFIYLIFVLVVLGYGCSSDPSSAVKAGMHQPHLAVIDVRGAIDEAGDTNAKNISDALTEAFDNEQAQAVVLNINSPGGSPVQSDEIWQAAMTLRQEHPNKKLYAVIGDMGASGAYYIASAADEIWVNPSSLVGSIGVILPSYNVKQLADRLGVQDNTMTAGQHKNILSPTKIMTPEERQHVQDLLDATHQNFIDAVKKGRGDRLKNPEQNQVFSGLFWTGKQAVELGLADKTGGLYQLKKSLDLQVVDYTYVDPMTKIFDRFGVQMGQGLAQGLKFGLNDSENKLQ